MTASELEAILERIETLSPSSRLSEKRQLLSGARERILALRQRGHSWRSLARELSAAIGETVSPDLLRTACLKRSKQRRSQRTIGGAPPVRTPSPKTSPVIPAPVAGGDAFGAKGLKL